MSDLARRRGTAPLPPPGPARHASTQSTTSSTSTSPTLVSAPLGSAPLASATSESSELGVLSCTSGDEDGEADGSVSWASSASWSEVGSDRALSPHAATTPWDTIAARGTQHLGVRSVSSANESGSSSSDDSDDSPGLFPIGGGPSSSVVVAAHIPGLVSARRGAHDEDVDLSSALSPLPSPALVATYKPSSPPRSKVPAATAAAADDDVFAAEPESAGGAGWGWGIGKVFTFVARALLDVDDDPAATTTSSASAASEYHPPTPARVVRRRTSPSPTRRPPQQQVVDEEEDSDRFPALSLATALPRSQSHASMHNHHRSFNNARDYVPSTYTAAAAPPDPPVEPASASASASSFRWPFSQLRSWISADDLADDGEEEAAQYGRETENVLGGYPDLRQMDGLDTLGLRLGLNLGMAAEDAVASSSADDVGDAYRKYSAAAGARAGRSDGGGGVAAAAVF
ncbi:hypothetical protein H9P43_005627 [Blastocladiella emersonii ATCC 22665]|nr:hypothetical protein H9P43_005627 [Blastocladiella emersonii ATCC 22665]